MYFKLLLTSKICLMTIKSGVRATTRADKLAIISGVAI